MFRLFCILLLCVKPWGLSAQEEKPKADLSTPYDAIHTHLYYLQTEHYDPNMSARVMPAIGEEARTAAIQLKQIFDGKGLRIRYNLLPDSADHLDTVTKKNIYTPFPEKLPEIYLEKNRKTQRWQYSRESLAAIARLHGQVYPLGSDLLINILPAWGHAKFLGLEIWQYISMALFLLLAYLLYVVACRVFRVSIDLFARANFGTDAFDHEAVSRMARLLSYLLVSYLVYFFLPILQLTANVSYYLIVGLRISNTVFVISILLSGVDVIRSFLLYKAKSTEHKTDDQWIPIIMRSIKVVIVVAGIIHVLGILEVNITALIAGLSIGGLAVALAAQETVRNLFGSLMILADRQFQVGDLITADGVTGTVEDIGFRSTKIRTLDSSLVTIPNGNLTNIVVNNLGARQYRRYNAQLAIAYHTPVELVEVFVKGLRELILSHPGTRKEEYYIHLNNLNESALSILFIIYFNTNDYAIEVKYREEVLLGVLRLAQQLGVRFAHPTTSLYVEATPQGSRLPQYEDKLRDAEYNLHQFLQQYQAQYKTKEEEEDSQSPLNLELPPEK
jgi:MscS family membrane protein